LEQLNEHCRGIATFIKDYLAGSEETIMQVIRYRINLDTIYQLFRWLSTINIDIGGQTLRIGDG
jgi:hypothetical protein